MILTKKIGFKKLLILAVALIVVLAVGAAATAAGGGAAQVKEAAHVRIVIDGLPGKYADVPIEMNDRILLPFREILTKLGVPNDDDHIIWNDDEESVTVIDGGNTIKLFIGSPVMTLNGEELTFDVAPYFYEANNRTYVPVRAVSELLDKFVMWEDATTTVFIRDKVNYAETLKILESMQSADSQTKIVANTKSATTLAISSDDFEIEGAGSDGALRVTMEMTQMLMADVETNTYHIKQVSNIGGTKIGSEMVLYNNKIYMKLEGEGLGWSEVTTDGGFDFNELTDQAKILESQIAGTDLSDTAMALSIYKNADKSYSLVGSPVSLSNMNSLLSSLTSLMPQLSENAVMSMKLNNFQMSETLSENFEPLNAVTELNLDMTVTETAVNGAKATYNMNMDMFITIDYDVVDADFTIEIPAEILSL